ncbi:MAG TPA: hypothetical protein PLT68_11460, partial [Actinomycetota bacterium]|nr:hypothetical protein [Actinomycetota bacterium]
MSDPNLHWDGQHWLRWDGENWIPDSSIAPPTPPRKRHTGLIVAAIAMVVVIALLLAGGGFLLVRNLASDTTTDPGQGTVITTVPINGTQDSFTDSVGRDQQIPAKTTQQPVTVPGGEPGLYGGTKNESYCDRQRLIEYLMANPDKGRAWAGVLGIAYERIPGYVMKLTPMLLRSDTLVTNHGFKNGQATSFLSVLQAGSAVLAGRRGLPVVRCYCGNPLTPAPTNVPNATYKGPTWPGWNPQSITVIVQNVTFIDIFIVVNPWTGEQFTRPAGTAGPQDGTVGGKPTQTTRPPDTGTDTSNQVEDVTGFLDAVMAGNYGAADGFCTPGFIGKFGGAANLAPGWGALTSYQITGAYAGDTFVAVYVEETWEGGFRSSTYYVTKTGGTYIEDADFNDTDSGYTEEPWTEEPYT